MKKITLTGISLLIAVIMSIAVMTFGVSAADAPEISINNVTARAGSTADITVSLSDNPGLIVMRLFVEYDDEYFSIKSVTDSGRLGVSTHSNAYDKSPYTFFWNNPLRTTDITASGDLATITFDIADDTPNGTYDIKIYKEDYDVLTTDLDKIGDDFECIDGSIKVTGGSSSSSSTSSSSSSSSSSYDDPTIKVSNASVRAGNTFNVTVSIDNNPGIIALRTMLDYNDEYFEIVKVADNGILGDYVHGDVYDEAPYALYWSNPLNARDITKDGKLVTVTFSSKSTTPAGRYKITASSDNYDIINYDLDALGNDFDFVSGVVTVTKAATSTDTSKDDED
ncbi:MAG: hypothetical protein IJ391_02105, partial [Clostridia bacterium]|nr:hypothetical protein [Clostridia bacterium]